MTTLNEFAYQISNSNLRFGPGATREVGEDLRDLRAQKVLLVIDPKLAELPVVQIVREAIEQVGISYELFSRVRTEPTQDNFLEATKAALDYGADSFVAVGGGSTIDTAKAANLYSTHPADLLEYVNAPIGRGTPVPGPLKPLIAIPTTAGTGSETTGTAIFDYTIQKAKTGISNRYLRPTLGIVDPENTRTQPPAVAASTGLDVLCHAYESYTAIPYTSRVYPKLPKLRPAYQGCNPISDLWALEAIRLCHQFLRRAVADPTDDQAREQMLLASSIAGIGFGNAGCHLPHAMSYPIAGGVKLFRPKGYDVDHPIVPHGMSVILSAPAVAQFCAPANPQRHLDVAAAMGVDILRAQLADAGEILAEALTSIIQDLEMPNGLKEVGYSSDDIGSLVRGAMPQERLTKLSPRPASAEDLAKLFETAMQIW